MTDAAERLQAMPAVREETRRLNKGKPFIHPEAPWAWVASVLASLQAAERLAAAMEVIADVETARAETAEASLRVAEEALRRIAESGAYDPPAVTTGNYDLTGWSKASDLRAIAAAALLQGADK